MKNKKPLSIALAVLIIFIAYAYAAYADVYVTDISGHWAEKVIDVWLEKGYITGYADNTFRPGNDVTRAEFARILYGVGAETELDRAAIDTGVSFSDVSSDDWYYEPVMHLATAGIINGYSDGTFRPNAKITRQDAATILGRFFNISGDSSDKTGGFADEDRIAAYAKPYFNGMVENDYISGYTDNTLRPAALIKRLPSIKKISCSGMLIFNSSIVSRPINTVSSKTSAGYAERSHWDLKKPLVSMADRK